MRNSHQVPLTTKITKRHRETQNLSRADFKLDNMEQNTTKTRKSTKMIYGTNSVQNEPKLMKTRKRIKTQQKCIKNDFHATMNFHQMSTSVRCKMEQTKFQKQPNATQQWHMWCHFLIKTIKIEVANASKTNEIHHQHGVKSCSKVLGSLECARKTAIPGMKMCMNQSHTTMNKHEQWHTRCHSLIESDTIQALNNSF